MKPLATMLLILAWVTALAQDDAQTGAHKPSQAAADVLREVAGADGAFIAAADVKERFSKENLASLLQLPPEEEIVVLSLTGSQIRQALERSVSLYPQPNSSFLQLSGFEVTFKPSAPAGQRIVSVTVNGSKLEDGQSYQVAMPSSLGRGGQGYFKVWDKANIVKTISGTTVQAALKGKRMGDSSPRWSSAG